jgi:hypothetical protein
MNLDPVADFLNSRYSVGIPLASGAEEDVEETYGGETYRIRFGAPPLIVEDRKDYPRGDGGKPDFTKAPVSIQGASAREIVKVLLEMGRLGRKGAYVVMGDGRDEERKEAGRQKWMAWAMSEARNTQAEWMQYAMAAKAPGALPPIMPERVRRAINFLQKYSSEVRSTGRKRFICTRDGNDFDTLESALEYVRSIYSAELTQSGEQAERYVQDNQKVMESAARAGQLSRLPEPPSVETPVSDVAEGDRLLTEAVRKKVKITRAEKAGLVAGNAETIARLKDQIDGALEPVVSA